MAKHKLQVFFAFQFVDAHVPKTDREFALIRAINEANAEVRRLYPDYYIEWMDCTLQSGGPIAGQIADLISDCDVLIADLSEVNTNVMFEVGFGYALQRMLSKRIIWLIHDSVDISILPSDIVGLYHQKYNANNLKAILAHEIREASLDLIAHQREATGLSESTRALRDFWKFDGDSLDIVCSVMPDIERTEYAEAHHRNFLRYAVFGDLDSLIHVERNIARLFPNIAINSYSPIEHAEFGRGDGLIVIGGPSWNSRFTELQSRLPFHFIENEKGVDDPLIFDRYPDCEFRPSYVSGMPRTDISLFVRYQRPQRSPCFLVAGCLTYGVLGAARSFLNGNASENAEGLESMVDGDDFILVFETEIELASSRPTFSHVKDPVLLMKKGRNDPEYEPVVENVDRYRAGAVTQS